MRKMEKSERKSGMNKYKTCEKRMTSLNDVNGCLKKEKEKLKLIAGLEPATS